MGGPGEPTIALEAQEAIILRDWEQRGRENLRVNMVRRSFESLLKIEPKVDRAKTPRGEILLLLVKREFNLGDGKFQYLGEALPCAQFQTMGIDKAERSPISRSRWPHATPCPNSML